MGRPSKITDEVRRRILEAVTVGAPNEIAAQYAGIGVSTLQRWLATDRSPYREFREEFTRAREKCAVMDLATISEAARGTVITHAAHVKRHPKRTIRHPDGRVETIEAYEETIPARTEKRPGDWRAAGWRLAHRYPELFGKLLVENRLTNATGTGPVEVSRVPVVAGLPRERLEELADWGADDDDTPAEDG